MAEASGNAISPTRSQDFPEWYQQVVRAADLAENSEVRGCMVIKPWGFGLWENIQRQLDAKFKATGHRNAYFPLLIPLSYFEQEAAHVEGFAKECAVVTHHRLELDAKGKMRPAPAAELSEPLVIRPTSETIIGASYAKWVQSYRDLPILLNQWANVMRWEMRTRLFLRTSEFLWQEGHTVHESEEEARAETARMLEVYREFMWEHLALPVFSGEKTESERFPGAVNTYCVEGMMQDGKAVQAGTSHFLGQNFARSSNIRFVSRSGTPEFAWTTSWGCSTRLIGALVMTHGDDDGLILPPRVAPAHAVILPITPKPVHRAPVLEAAARLADALRGQRFANETIQVEVDSREISGGVKNWDWIKRGIPIRLEIGPRDLAQGTLALARRDQPPKEKRTLPVAQAVSEMPALLENIQAGLLHRARSFRDQRTVRIKSQTDFYDFFSAADSSERGGFALVDWAGDSQLEAKLKDELKVTIRCIPLDAEVATESGGACFLTNRPNARRVLFGKAY